MAILKLCNTILKNIWAPPQGLLKNIKKLNKIVWLQMVGRRLSTGGPEFNHSLCQVEVMVFCDMGYSILYAPCTDLRKLTNLVAAEYC